MSTLRVLMICLLACTLIVSEEASHPQDETAFNGATEADTVVAEDPSDMFPKVTDNIDSLLSTNKLKEGKEGQKAKSDDMIADIDNKLKRSGKLTENEMAVGIPLLNEILKKDPMLASNIKEKPTAHKGSSSSGGDEVLATDLCKKLSQNECAAECKEYHADVTNTTARDAVLVKGLKHLDSVSKDAKEIRSEAQKTCENWRKKSHNHNQAQRVAGLVKSEAAPFLHCLCQQDLGTSFCSLKHKESLQAVDTTFGDALVSSADLKLDSKPIRTKKELLQHPQMAQMIKSLLAETGDKTPNGRPKTLMDHIAQQNGAVGELMQTRQSNHVCRTFGQDTAKAFNYLRGTLTTATGGFVSCGLGCDVSGALHAECTLFESFKVELGYDFVKKYFFLKIKICVPGLSDVLDVLSDIPVVKGFLASNGIDGGCLLLGEGRLSPDDGLVHITTTYSIRVAIMKGIFQSSTYINYDSCKKPRLKYCLSFMFKDLGLTGSLSFALCMATQTENSFSGNTGTDGWAIMATVYLSLKIDLWIYGRTVASTDKSFIIGSRSTCSGVKRTLSKKYQAMQKRIRRKRVSIAPAHKLCSDVRYGSHYTSKFGTAFTTFRACRQACSDVDHKGKKLILKGSWWHNPGCFLTVNSDGSKGNCHWNENSGTKRLPVGIYRQLCDPPPRKRLQWTPRSYYDRMRYATNSLPISLKGTGSGAWGGGQVLCSNPSEGGGMSWFHSLKNPYGNWKMHWRYTRSSPTNGGQVFLKSDKTNKWLCSNTENGGFSWTNDGADSSWKNCQPRYPDYAWTLHWSGSGVLKPGMTVFLKSQHLGKYLKSSAAENAAMAWSWSQPSAATFKIYF